ncbi:hypothetical protein MBLNU457_1515t1 [Dothideomycetes sp. NU457]
MAVQAIANRQTYPAIGGYYHNAQSGSPIQSQHPQGDAYPRNMYNQNFQFHQPLYNYAQYAMPQHPAYASQSGASPQSYQSVSNAHSILMSGHPSSPLTSQQSPIQTPVTSAPAHTMKGDNSIIDMRQALNPVQPSHSNMSTSNNSRSDPTAAAPGPIPATTPLVVRQDSNGVQWIAFEYSRDRVKSEYTIRCDVESVDTLTLSDVFKSANCVYPRAYGDRTSYKGNRLHYESECNTVGWALAELNPCLRDKRGLIQRAVDSWRNSNQDPKLRSRRVRRMAKISTRKAAMANNPSSALSANPSSHNSSVASMRPNHMMATAGQMQHGRHPFDGTMGHPNEEMVSMFSSMQ